MQPDSGISRCSNAPSDVPAGKPGRSLSADKFGSAAGEYVSFVAEFSLWLDFRDELKDLHIGPWELISPRRLKLRRGPFSPSGHYERKSGAAFSTPGRCNPLRRRKRYGEVYGKSYLTESKSEEL